MTASDEPRPSAAARALDQKLLKIKAQIRRNWLEVGTILAQVQEALAYRELGFPNFQQYVEDRLGISPRWASYLVCMVRKAERFGIDPEQVARLDISKGLEIFRLDDAQQAKRLVDQTIQQDTPLTEVKRQVAVAMGRIPDGESQTVRKVWHFSPSQWSVVSQAIKAVSLATGSDSETYAIELIAADYLAGIGLEPEDRGRRVAG